MEPGVSRTASIFVIAILASAARGEAGCQMFEHKGFVGDSVTIDSNRGLAQLGTLNDRVSSIKVSSQCLLVAYADARFAGATTTFSPGEHAALPEGWDDRISSARCNCR
jgi:beta/gamma crystallin